MSLYRQSSCMLFVQQTHLQLLGVVISEYSSDCNEFTLMLMFDYLFSWMLIIWWEKYIPCSWRYGPLWLLFASKREMTIYYQTKPRQGKHINAKSGHNFSSGTSQHDGRGDLSWRICINYVAYKGTMFIFATASNNYPLTNPRVYIAVCHHSK